MEHVKLFAKRLNIPRLIRCGAGRAEGGWGGWEGGPLVAPHARSAANPSGLCRRAARVPVTLQALR